MERERNEGAGDATPCGKTRLDPGSFVEHRRRSYNPPYQHGAVIHLTNPHWIGGYRSCLGIASNLVLSCTNRRADVGRRRFELRAFTYKRLKF